MTFKGEPDRTMGVSSLRNSPLIPDYLEPVRYPRAFDKLAV
jgi:hypothetical protein